MATTLASMNTEVALALGNPSNLSSLIDAWLNQAQLALATALRIRELEKAATITMVTSPVTDIYNQPTDFWAPQIMVNTSKNRAEVKLKPIDVIVRQEPTPVQDPVQYAIRGATFVVRPAPVDADVLELTYRFRPPTMTSTQDMTLPDEFRPVVVFEAISRALFIQGEEERSTLFGQQRDKELASIGDQRGEEMFGRQEGAVIQWSGIEGRR